MLWLTKQFWKPLKITIESKMKSMFESLTFLTVVHYETYGRALFSCGKRRGVFFSNSVHFFLLTHDFPPPSPSPSFLSSQTHLNTLVRVSGVVTRRSTVFPQLKYTKFDCGKCGAILGPFYQETSTSEIRISNCSGCESKGPFTVNAEDVSLKYWLVETLDFPLEDSK